MSHVQKKRRRSLCCLMLPEPQATSKLRHEQTTWHRTERTPSLRLKRCRGDGQSNRVSLETVEETRPIFTWEASGSDEVSFPESSLPGRRLVRQRTGQAGGAQRGQPAVEQFYLCIICWNRWAPLSGISALRDFAFCALELCSWRPIGVSMSSPTFSWSRPQQLEWCTAVGMSSCVMLEWGLSGFRNWWKTVRSVRCMGPTTCQTSWPKMSLVTCWTNTQQLWASVSSRKGRVFSCAVMTYAVQATTDRSHEVPAKEEWLSFFPTSHWSVLSKMVKCSTPSFCATTEPSWILLKVFWHNCFCDSWRKKVFSGCQVVCGEVPFSV